MTEVSSKSLYAARILAILCSVAAHMPGNGAEGKILAMAGTMGVPFFFFAAGLFFRPDDHTAWIRFIKKVGVPWLFSGTVMWAIGSLNHYNNLTMLAFVLGKGSYLYYMTVSAVLYLVFSYIPQRFYPVCMGVGVLGMAGLHYGLVIVSPYLTVTYWLPYFCVGLLLGAGKPENAEKLMLFVKQHMVLIIVLWFCVAGLYFYTGTINYFTWFAIPFSFLSIAFLLCMGTFLGKCKGNWVRQMGSNTLGIYIWHVYIAGKISAHTLRFGFFHVFTPILAVAVTYGLLYLGNRMAILVHAEKPYGLLTGFAQKHRARSDFENTKSEAKE